MTAQQEKDPRKVVRFVGKTQLERLDMWDNVYQPFGGSPDIKQYHGDLFFKTSKSSDAIEESPKKFVLLAGKDPRGDIFAKDKRQRAAIVNCFHTIENAIRASGYILYDAHLDQERLPALKTKAEQMSKRWLTNFPSQTPKEFERTKQETIDLIKQLGQNPFKVTDKERREMYRLLIKGSSGRDSDHRLNKLISKETIDLVIKYIRFAQIHVDETIVRFIPIHNIFETERLSYRNKLFGTIDNLLEIAKTVYRRPEQQGQTIAEIDTIQSHLNSIQANPYLHLVFELKPLLGNVRQAVRENRPPENVQHMCDLIRKTLDDAEEQYKKEPNLRHRRT